jgi:hypothetical protein
VVARHTDRPRRWIHNGQIYNFVICASHAKASVTLILRIYLHHNSGCGTRVKKIRLNFTADFTVHCFKISENRWNRAGPNSKTADFTVH